MRITESKLRRFIRKVISESIDGVGMTLPTNAEHAREEGYLDDASFYGGSSIDRMYPGYHYSPELGEAVKEKAKEIEYYANLNMNKNYHLGGRGAPQVDIEAYKNDEIAMFCDDHEITRADFDYICKEEGCTL